MRGEISHGWEQDPLLGSPQRGVAGCPQGDWVLPPQHPGSAKIPGHHRWHRGLRTAGSDYVQARRGSCQTEGWEPFSPFPCTLWAWGGEMPLSVSEMTELSVYPHPDRGGGGDGGREFNLEKIK